MKPLKNEQHERFAQLVALGSNHTAACISAGYSKRSAVQTAARLMTIDKVSARIRELVAAAAARTEVTLESLIGDAMRCRDLGIWHGQINAAVLAVKELGILTGFRIEKRETRRLDPATVTDEELVAILRAGSVDVKPLPLSPKRLDAPLDVGANVGAAHDVPEKSTVPSTASAELSAEATSAIPVEETLQTPEARAAWRTKMATRADRTKSRARSKG